MKLGLVEVNDVRFVVDHHGRMWQRKVGKQGDFYWEFVVDNEKGEVVLTRHRGHCEMVKYLKGSVYHNYRDVAYSGCFVNVRKRVKAKFVTVDIDDDGNIVSKKRG